MLALVPGHRLPNVFAWITAITDGFQQTIVHERTFPPLFYRPLSGRSVPITLSPQDGITAKTHRGRNLGTQKIVRTRCIAHDDIHGSDKKFVFPHDQDHVLRTRHRPPTDPAVLSTLEPLALRRNTSMMSHSSSGTSPSSPATVRGHHE
jgi:hypothetical protein